MSNATQEQRNQSQSGKAKSKEQSDEERDSTVGQEDQGLRTLSGGTSLRLCEGRGAAQVAWSIQPPNQGFREDPAEEEPDWAGKI